jgi:predicted metal-binding membrane protein
MQTTQSTSATSTPTLRQVTRPTSVLLVVAALAWVAVVMLARDMGVMPGTMGLTFAPFVGVWALMMSAMMLPTVTPFAALYTRTLTDHRASRITSLALGYLLVWTVTAVPAYALALLAQDLTVTRPTAATALAAVIFAGCGIYQLTPLKDRCLSRCRSPLGFALKYGSYRGRLRDLRVGINHGAFCVGCCWALMLVLVAVGLMNLLFMVALSAIVLAEKTWSWGPKLSRAVAIMALVLAVAVVVRPSLAAGLYQAPDMTGSTMTMASSS